MIDLTMPGSGLVADLGTMTYKVTEEAVALRASALAAAKGITKITSAEAMEAANPVLRLVKGCISFMADSKDEVKAPVIKLGKAIEAEAKSYSAPLLEEEARLKNLVAQYVESTREKQVEETRQFGAPMTASAPGSGIQIVEEWDFELVDEVQAYVASPGLFELKPKRAAIIAALKGGLEIPFIKPIRKTGVRVSS